jgi:hypothetical protein
MALYPLSAYYTTTLTPRVTSYELLADRILRQLGAPLINLEVACSTVYDHIGQAIEWYTKYAGHTEEFLIFDSTMYVRGLGIKLDRLFSITPETSALDLSATNFQDMSGNVISNPNYIFDYDLNLYRKVKAVQSFVEGSSSGINSLFTIEQALAQQTYFAYALGNYGFDLVTWEIMKQWLEMRERVLAQKVYYRFDPRTQYLRLLPEPSPDKKYYGLVQCTVERPIRDLVRERWVMQYALALTKITIANVRGKFGGTALFGGGMLNATDMMTQGLQEKEKLEQELMYTPGETDPVPFFVG